MINGLVFVSIVVAALFIGLILGLSSVFIAKDIPKRISILYAFSFLYFPISLIKANKNFYMKRHLHLEEYAGKRKMKSKDKQVLKESLDTLGFKLFVIGKATKEVLNIKWQIQMFVISVLEYDRMHRYNSVKTKRNIEKYGLFEYIISLFKLANKSVTKVISSDIFSTARTSSKIKKYA